jgi:hypothetical protein
VKFHWKALELVSSLNGTINTIAKGEPVFDGQLVHSARFLTFNRIWHWGHLRGFSVLGSHAYPQWEQTIF